MDKVVYEHWLRPIPLSSRMSARIPLARLTHPAILPISPRTFGNNVPKSLHKTKRSWWPNVTRANLTVSVLDGSPMGPTLKGKEKEVIGAVPRTQALRGVKIAVRDLKDVDKAGGVEGLLVSCDLMDRWMIADGLSCRDRQRISRHSDSNCEQSCLKGYISSGKGVYSSRSQRYNRAEAREERGSEHPPQE
jgi:ribosomal protein L28